MRSILTEHDVKLLNDLYRELPSPIWTATNALRIFPPAHSLEGVELAQFLDAHAKVTQIMERMTKILGQPDNT
ncbi:MAG: hypothetical protein ABI216_04335 [Devosia sp.]